MKPQFLLLSLAALTLLGSCAKDDTIPENGGASGEFVSATLSVQLAPQDEATPTVVSKSMAADNSSEGFSVRFGPAPAAATAAAPAAPAPATRTIAQELTNVWVLQFNSSGANVSTTNVGTLAAGAYLTIPSLQVGTGYTICVVANGVASGLSKTNPATLAAFESTMFHTTAVTDATKLPMSGKLTDVSVIDLGDGKGKLKGLDEAPLALMVKRIHAELTLTVDFGVTDYTLTGAQLYNVPIGATYGWNSATTTFPDNTVVANFGYTDTTKAGLASLTPTTSGTKTTYKWFVGDNRRGEVAGLTTQPDRNKAKAPAYATFARITIDGAGTIMYDVYLGSSAVTNFDVKRNMTYTLTTAIKGTADFQESLIGTDARVSSQGFPIYLTDTKTDSPILISPKSMESTATMIWGPTATVPGAQDIFNGKTNTDAIMAKSATAYPAAKYCRGLSAKHYLPSRAELMLMWIYQSAIPVADRSASDGFWSSTEISSSTSSAWYVDFSHGLTNYIVKSNTCSARCVREL